MIAVNYYRNKFLNTKQIIMRKSVLRCAENSEKL